MFQFPGRGVRTTFGMLPTAWDLPSAYGYDVKAPPIVRRHLFVRPSRPGVWWLDELVVEGLDRQGVLVEMVRTWHDPQVLARADRDAPDVPDALDLAFSFSHTHNPNASSPNALGGVLGKDGVWPMAGARLTITPERLLVVTVMHMQCMNVPTPRVAAVCTAIEEG